MSLSEHFTTEHLHPIDIVEHLAEHHDWDFDRIADELEIVGSHGMSGIERFLMGSVSQAVLEYAPCSVLIVRQPQGAQGAEAAHADAGSPQLSGTADRPLRLLLTATRAPAVSFSPMRRATIAVVAILASLAIPSFLAWLPNYRLRSGAEEIQSTLQFARLTAIKENATVKVEFNTANETYQASVQKPLEPARIFRKGRMPAGVDIFSVFIFNAAEIQINIIQLSEYLSRCIGYFPAHGQNVLNCFTAGMWFIT